MPIEVNNLTINSGLSTGNESEDDNAAQNSVDYHEHMEKLKSEIMEECQHLIKISLKTRRER